MSATTVEEVLYRIQADAAQAVAEMERFRKAERDVGNEHENTNRKRRTAAKEVTGFGEKMREFATGQRRDGMIARWYAGELASVLPVTGQAKAAFAGLAAGIVGGGGVALAIEAVAWGAKFLAAAFNEAAEAEKKAKEEAEAHTKVLRDLKRSTDDYLFSLSGAPASLGFLREKLREIGDESEPLKKRLAEVREEIERLADAGPMAENIVPQALTEEEEALVAKLKRLSEREAEVRKSFAGRVVGEESKARDEAEEKARTEREAKAKQAREREQAEEIAYRKAKAAALIAADDAEFMRAYERQLEREAKLNEIADAEFVKEMEREEAKARILAEREALAVAHGDEQHAAELVRLEEWKAQRLAIFVDDADQRLLIEQEYQTKRAAIIAESMSAEMRYVADAQRAMRELGRSIATSMANDAIRGFQGIITQSRAYNRAMRAAGDETNRSADLSGAAFAAFTQNALASLSAQALAKSVFYLAEGFALASNPATAALAPLAFKASATFAAVGALAGAGAFAIGAVRPMTRAERESVEQFEESRREPASSANASGREVTEDVDETGVRTREVRIVYVGDPFETEAERAARAARMLDLMDDLDLRAREEG